MGVLVAALCGFAFGAGLELAGMTSPGKVLAFLDPLGRWDPTLAFVMGGALAVSSVGFAWAGRMRRPWLAATFDLPTRRDLDLDLVLGAILFGIGWGLVGLCPGPAIANLWRPSSALRVFVAALLAGLAIHRLYLRLRDAR
jgi:uncharacterized membrane protein YedE/YeeE